MVAEIVTRSCSGDWDREWSRIYGIGSGGGYWDRERWLRFGSGIVAEIGIGGGGEDWDREL